MRLVLFSRVTPLALILAGALAASSALYEHRGVIQALQLALGLVLVSSGGMLYGAQRTREVYRQVLEEQRRR